MLQTNLDTNAFFAEQTAKILAAKPKPKPTVGDDKNKKEEIPAKKYPTQVALSTRTTLPIGSEADVDKYLAQLKKQLMAHIDKGETVMIFK